MGSASGAIVAACLGAIPAGPSAAQSLSLAVAAPVTSIDPHYHNLSPNISLAAHVFEPLVDMDASAHPIPALAESWRLIDDQTWEFHLREAKFHDGHDFTAADVVASIERVPRVKNSPSSFATYTKQIGSMEIVDPHTIRIRTKGVYPLLPLDLAQVSIISAAVGPDSPTEDFNSGRSAVGTGPYRFVSYKPGDRVELDRNESWWGQKPVWQHVTYRMISNDGARTAALLAGDVALIDAVPTTDISTVRVNPKVSLAETVGLRVIYLAVDQSRDGPTPFVTGPNGEKLDRNPLKDRRVREALSIAINRPAVVERVMENAAIPSGQFLPPGSFSYTPDLPPPAFDPQRAKRLLADAGFPDGFRITLHSSNDRYVNDAKIVQAIGQMWTRIGVRTTVDSLPWTSYVGHANKQEYSAMLFGWGSQTGEASDALRALIATSDPAQGRGAANRGRYTNPALDTLLARALSTTDDQAREELLRQATRMAMDDVAIIPLHNQKNTWAMRAGLTYTPRADEETRAAGLRPVQ